MSTIEYLSQLADRHPVLSAEETAELCRRIRVGITEIPADLGTRVDHHLDDDARDALDRLVRHNARLILRSYAQYHAYSRRLGEEELMSHLIEHVLHAARTYDTASSRWTSWYMRRVGYTLRSSLIPMTRKGRTAPGEVLSMDDVVPGERNLVESIGEEDSAIAGTADADEAREFVAICEAAMTSERQRQVLRAMLGARGARGSILDIGSPEICALEDVAEALGLSRERVRQHRARVAELLAADPAVKAWMEARGYRVPESRTADAERSSAGKAGGKARWAA